LKFAMPACADYTGGASPETTGVSAIVVTAVFSTTAYRSFVIAPVDGPDDRKY
jgi:hypothetical protein